MKQTVAQAAVAAQARFGRYTVLSTVSRTNYVNAVCDCGTLREVQIGHLKRGLIKSCGCLRNEMRFEARTHGATRGSKTPEYRSWSSMKTRCSNPNDDRFCDYGGRGIAICPQWVASFETFLADMGQRPSAAHTLDRIDVDGNYEPGNCRWATRYEQAGNKRTSVHVVVNGKMMCLSAARRELGVGRGLFESRLYKRHWTAEQALGLCSPPSLTQERVI